VALGTDTPGVLLLTEGVGVVLLLKGVGEPKEQAIVTNMRTRDVKMSKLFLLGFMPTSLIYLDCLSYFVKSLPCRR
jgi:hypothetical protein